VGKCDFDLIVIGGGGGGITAVTLASGLGKRVAMVDKKKFGGECTWSGCVPSKALLCSAKVTRLIGTAQQYGLTVDGSISIGNDRVMESVRAVVQKVYSNEGSGHFQKLGITAIEDAEVSFVNENTVSVNGKAMSAAKFIITTGSGPLVPPIPGLDNIKYFTNETIFSIEKLPASLIILGGGPIGAELATAFIRLGVKVSLVEMAPAILIREDPELVNILTEKMAGEGVAIMTGTKAVSVEKSDNGITLVYESAGVPGRVTADSLLVAVGRKAHTAGLNLEAAGVAYDARGIRVDKYLRTTAKNIYAAGDVVGPYQFSHMANYQAIVATSNALLPFSRKATYGPVPWCTFTDPELARSGLTEQEAKDRYGRGVRVYRVPYSGIDRAATDRTESGLAKIVCAKRGSILGVHILGERAGEVMHEIHAAQSLGIPLYRLDQVIHAYPAYNDVVKQAARSAYIDRIQDNPIVKLIKFFRGSG
jgi:pyruvate/2-oxoglutarate dehydrogenase complex dihydrolipoamide dehydrogenase (E3) component